MEEWIVGRTSFFNVYKKLEGLVFYQVKEGKVVVKNAIPKYKSYVKQILKIR